MVDSSSNGHKNNIQVTVMHNQTTSCKSNYVLIVQTATITCMVGSACLQCCSTLSLIKAYQLCRYACHEQGNHEVISFAMCRCKCCPM